MNKELTNEWLAHLNNTLHQLPKEVLANFIISLYCDNNVLDGRIDLLAAFNQPSTLHQLFITHVHYINTETGYIRDSESGVISRR